MKRRMVEWRREKNMDGRDRGQLIFADFPFIPSEADYLVPEQFNFYGVRLLASRPTLNLEDQSIPLRLTCPAWVPLPVAMLPPA
jgi:hypothetical protein